MSVTEPEAATATGPDGSPPVADRSTRPGFSTPLLLRQALPGALLLGLAVRLVVPVGDPDTFWHLRAGDDLRRTWSFRSPDPWSQFASRPWTLHEWLPELVASLVYQVGGLAAVALLLPLGAVATGAVLWWACRRATSIIPSALLMAIALGAMTGGLSVRPQLVTFALAALFSGAWLATAADLRPRWWLVPATWLWACSHGMWFTGVLVGGVVVAGLAVQRGVPARRLAGLASVPALGLLGAALTPVGPGLLLAPLTVRAYTRFVTEWRAPTLGDPFFVLALVLLAVPLLIWARSRRVPSWPELGVLLLAALITLAYARTVAVGAALAAPVAALAVEHVLPLRREPRRRREVTLTATLAAVGLAVAAALAPGVAASPTGVPNALDAQLSALPAGTVVYNDYALGGWLHWRYPRLQPVIDGRTEIYDISYVESYVDSLIVRPGWQDFITRTKATYALVDAQSAPASALVEVLRWSVVGRDGTFVLLRAAAT